MNKQEFYNTLLQQKSSTHIRMGHILLLFLLLSSCLPAFGQTNDPCSSIQVFGTSENTQSSDNSGAVFQGIVVSNPLTDQQAIRIFNENWEQVGECRSEECGNPYTFATPAGKYYVQVQLFNEDATWICQSDPIEVTVSEIPQPTNCEDIKVDISDLITENGSTTREVAISHIDQTANGIVTTIAISKRGISGSGILISCGTDCEELINYTLEEGEYVILISRFSITSNDFDEGCDYQIFIDVNPNCTDNDKDFICSQNDCDDNDASAGLKLNPGSSCDDGDPNTENDVYLEDGCTCAGTLIDAPNCTNITLNINPNNASTIDISGLTSAHYLVKVYDESWNQILDCSDDCASVGAYEAGLYRIHVILFDENWQYICETGFLKITIDGGNNCEAICQQPSINFNSQADVDAFCGCDVIEGNVRITGDITSLQPLNGIKQINGFLAIFKTDLTDFVGLESLEILESDLYIGENSTLTSLKGLENIGSIAGGLNIESNPVLENLDGLTINKTNSVNLSSNDVLNNILALNKITTLNFLTITANKKLPNLEGLNNLTNLGNGTTTGGGTTSLLVGGNASITTLSALSNLKNIDENLIIQFNAALTDCCGITHLIDNDPNNGQAKSGVMIDNNLVGCNSVAEILEHCQTNTPIDCQEILVSISDLQFDGGTVSRDIHIDVYTPANQITLVSITNRNTLENFFSCGADCTDEIDFTISEGEYIIQLLRAPKDNLSSEFSCERWIFLDVPANPCEDQDGDYICDYNDCDDTDPTQTIQLGAGSFCDDLNHNTHNDVVQEDGCTCHGTFVSDNPCDVISLSLNQNNSSVIDVNNKFGGKEFVKVYDKNWNIVRDCSSIPDYEGGCTSFGPFEPGLYRVYVQQYTDDWQYICETDFMEITIPDNQTGSRAVSNDVFDMATYLKAQTVQLEWIAGQISTTSNFVIERSNDGITFESIATIEKIQKTGRFFNFIDENPNFGSNYYRVQQTFEDQADRLSPTKKVDFYLNEKAIAVFPNPVQDRLLVQTKVLAGKKGSIHIYNVFGQKIETIPTKVFNQEFETIDVTAYQNGLYYLNIQAEKMPVISKKFLVEKMK